MTVSLEIINEIGIVTIDNPPVNAVSQAIRQQLIEMVTTTDQDPSIRGVVVRGAGRTFIAGADITEFDKPPIAPHLPAVVSAIENAAKPWAAVIHGAALGGGVEIALGCHYRMAYPASKIGLPEVTLGLIPGAGGTVRLPRLITPARAVTMVAGGKPITAETGLDWGLIDAIINDAPRTDASDGGAEHNQEQMPGHEDTTAIATAAKTMFAANGYDVRPVSNRAVVPDLPGDDFADVAARFVKRARGQDSPVAACAAIERALEMEAAPALAAERAAFLTLRDSTQASALRHIFFAERSVSKLDITAKIPPLPLAQIGIIGGGTMGSGIAAACLLAGLRVHMIERDATSVAAGMDRVHSILADSQRRGLISNARLATYRKAFQASSAYADLATADLVIEAAFEDLAVKQQIFADLEAHCGADAILATNTSYLDVDQIAAATQTPHRVIGLHFFSPAHIMKLLELVIPAAASPTAIATGLALGKSLRKITVPAGVCDGFIGNRIMAAYRRECDYMIEDGALPHEIDAAMRAFGFPMGIFAMQDLAGLDIAFAMRQRRAATRPQDERYVDIADKLCAAGRLGRKAGRGWYDYTDDKSGAIDPTVTALIHAESARKDITRRPIPDAEIISRILTVMQREGRAIVDAGIAQSTDAIDVTMINGYGFPRWRGGPMFMMRTASGNTEESTAETVPAPSTP